MWLTFEYYRDLSGDQDIIYQVDCDLAEDGNSFTDITIRDEDSYNVSYDLLPSDKQLEILEVARNEAAGCYEAMMEDYDEDDAEDFSDNLSIIDESGETIAK